MFSIPHLIVLFVVALIVFGPEKLPELARNIGKVMSEFRRISNEMRYTFEDHMREIERETEAKKTKESLPAAQPAENTIAFRAAAVGGEPNEEAAEANESAASAEGASGETAANSQEQSESPVATETEKNVGAGPA